MTSPDERAFVTMNRGVIRDQIILAHFRNQLRTAVNPVTGLLFTEDEIARATGPGTRFYIEADAIDLFGAAAQQRAAFFATQIDPRKANTEFLEQFHGKLWLGPDSKLPATGASGPVRATGTNGTIVPGSSTIGDPAAAVATDPNGLRYQNLTTATITNNEAVLTVVGIDTGFVTRLPANTELKWSSGVNPGTDPVATVIAPLDGGFDQETDEEYSQRITDRIRNRPASGNSTHFQAWAEEATVAVEQAFVYPVALNAGSTVIAIAEKRADILQASQIPEGPNARVPSAGTLTAVTNYLVAPASPVVPERVFIIVTSINPQQADMVLRVSMAKGRSGGWADVSPWPAYSSNFPDCKIKTVNGTGLVLTVETDIDLPNVAASLAGTNSPKMMLFNREISRWVQLDIASIVDPLPGGPGGRDFVITLNTEPVMFDADGNPRVTPVIEVGDRLSPYTDRAKIMAEAVETYFDSLGPGEVIEETDVRFARAVRQPRPATRYPIRAGQAVISVLIDALGGSAADAELTSISRNEPDRPTNVVDGPNMVTFGHTNVFPL